MGFVPGPDAGQNVELSLSVTYHTVVTGAFVYEEVGEDEGEDVGDRY